MSQLSPSPKFSATYIDADGYVVPAVGYKLYTYTAGTSTPKFTYTDYTLGTENTNPVVLDANGQADVWLGGNYKFILKTDADVTVWTVDSVNDLETGATLTTATLAGALTVTSTAVTWSGNPTHSGNHTFSGNVLVNGNTTLGDAAADTLTVNPNSVTWSGNPTHSGNHTFNGTVDITGAATFSANPAGKIVGGTYTPTRTGVANVAASSIYLAQYLRVGNTVTVSGVIDITPTAGATLTQFRLSLPIASAFTGSWLNGSGVAVAWVGSELPNCFSAIADATSDEMNFVGRPPTTAALSYAYHFTYLVA